MISCVPLLRRTQGYPLCSWIHRRPCMAFRTHFAPNVCTNPFLNVFAIQFGSSLSAVRVSGSNQHGETAAHCLGNVLLAPRSTPLKLFAASLLFLRVLHCLRHDLGSWPHTCPWMAAGRRRVTQQFCDGTLKFGLWLSSLRVQPWATMKALFARVDTARRELFC